MPLIDDIRTVIQEEINRPLASLRTEISRLEERINSAERALADQTSAVQRYDAKAMERCELNDERWTGRTQVLSERIEVSFKRIEDCLANANGALAGELRGLRGEVQSELKRTSESTSHLHKELTSQLSAAQSEIRSELNQGQGAVTATQKALSAEVLGLQNELRSEFKRQDASMGSLKEQLMIALQLGERLAKVEAALAELTREKIPPPEPVPTPKPKALVKGRK